VPFDDSLCNREAQAVTACFFISRRVETSERLREAGQLFFGNARAIVLNKYRRRLFIPNDADFCGAGVSHRVVDQVLKSSPQLSGAAEDVGFTAADEFDWLTKFGSIITYCLSKSEDRDAAHRLP
jgi:hypothetical protein